MSKIIYDFYQDIIWKIVLDNDHLGIVEKRINAVKKLTQYLPEDEKFYLILSCKNAFRVSYNPKSGKVVENHEPGYKKY